MEKEAENKSRFFSKSYIAFNGNFVRPLGKTITADSYYEQLTKPNMEILSKHPSKGIIFHQT